MRGRDIWAVMARARVIQDITDRTAAAIADDPVARAIVGKRLTKGEVKRLIKIISLTTVQETMRTLRKETIY